MSNKEYFQSLGINMTTQEAIEYIMMLQEGYKNRKIEHRLYNEDDPIPEDIIQMYLYFIHTNNFSLIVNNYKNAFITNEAIVEPGVTEEERKGLGLIYDYIGSYDFSKGSFNIFVESLKLHTLLYSTCPFSEFGGKIRTDIVVLKDVNYDVLGPKEAAAAFQKYISKVLEPSANNIFEYINECVKIMVDLIKIQPFNDGNKRTFRALFNLMLARIGIPPVYIAKEERAVYKEELLKAICQEEYQGILRFYYYKICDSIVELDVQKIYNIDGDEMNDDGGKSFIIEKKDESSN